jgi:hypothetical protein
MTFGAGRKIKNCFGAKENRERFLSQCVVYGTLPFGGYTLQ